MANLNIGRSKIIVHVSISDGVHLSMRVWTFSTMDYRMSWTDGGLATGYMGINKVWGRLEGTLGIEPYFIHGGKSEQLARWIWEHLRAASGNEISRIEVKFCCSERGGRDGVWPAQWVF